MTPEQLKVLLDTGGMGISLFALWMLWKRLNYLEDRMIGYLEEARKDRHKLQSEVTALKLSRDTGQWGEKPKNQTE